MAYPRDHVMLGGHLTRPYRKAKDPNRFIEVLCWDFDGFHRCWRPIVWIGRPDEKQVPPGEPLLWQLLALPGYYPDSQGVLCETAHAANDVRHGRQPRYRRPFRRDGEYRHWLLSGDPLGVRCSNCKTLHVLHHSAFGLPSATDPRVKSVES